MRHEITSLNTKRAIAASLKKAMRQKPFSKITVSEIITDCGVNRKTFYYHFEDVFALLKWMLEEEAINVVRQFDLLVNYEEAILFVMDYVEQNDFVINCACDAVGQEGMKQFFYTDFLGITASIIDHAEEQSGVSLEPDFKLFMAKFYTEAIAGTLLDWVKNRDKEDREKTVQYLSRIFRAATEFNAWIENGDPASVI